MDYGSATLSFANPLPVQLLPTETLLHLTRNALKISENLVLATLNLGQLCRDVRNLVVGVVGVGVLCRVWEVWYREKQRRKGVP
ncbi:hypothetical protein G7K_1439-t1 [Saitoella complicata NRRL Y-17804]|uniref:Uncharacterized protein n=1 Tax=Saitoella complicata (strain BCRC 22490 / CBS 7301 / JCM 7358 / NBRC 10748 / NRRL Y-17804) TaxID=698492 RepID=A0A0E9NBL2_SAICN|nr:hypothetical protein G7K_1439-t1 [Saitoella complicata NRRL Y-17804]